MTAVSETDFSIINACYGKQFLYKKYFLKLFRKPKTNFTFCGNLLNRLCCDHITEKYVSFDRNIPICFVHLL